MLRSVSGKSTFATETAEATVEATVEATINVPTLMPLPSEPGLLRWRVSYVSDF